MRSINDFLLVITLFLLAFYFIKIWKAKDRRLKKLKPIYVSCAFAVISNILMNHIITETQALFAYALYFSSLDWIVCFLFYFCVEYSDIDRKDKFNSNILLTLCLIDTISFFMNIITKHCFDVIPIGRDLEVFFDYNVTIFYVSHLFFDYLVFALSVFYLFLGFKKSTRINRLKYIHIFFIATVVVIFNAAYMIFDLQIDYSVMLYAFSGIFLYYGPFLHSHQRLLAKLLTLGTKGVNFGIIVFNNEQKCIFVNDFIKKLLKVDASTILSSVYIKEWLKDKDLMPPHDFSEDFEFKGETKSFYYHITYQRFYDEEKKLLGCYYTVSDITTEIERHEREHMLATHDKLTGIYNRDYFYEKVELELQRNPYTEYVILVSDVLNFKLVNDLYGTEKGDELLKTIATELRNKCKKGTLFARLHNDNFAVFMPKIRYTEEAFLTALSDIFSMKNKLPQHLVCHIGVYEIVEKNIPVSFMCDRAFIALSTIHSQYNERIAYYNERLRETVIHQQELMNELPIAIENKELHMYLQPQFDAKGNVLGSEALVRWHHPKKGKILPSDFITAIEKNGMVSQVDYYIWHRACEKLREWKDKGITNIYISVNISPKDFYLLDIYKTFMDLVEEYGISPANLNLEITETAIMQDFDRQIELIDKLREAGFAVEIDDFGSGYSSLNMLKDINADVLKVDMAFLHESKHHKKSRIILEKIISLSKELGMKVVTEGVESQSQVDFLDNVGCDIYQGYYFSKPIPVQEFEEKYLSKE